MKVLFFFFLLPTLAYANSEVTNFTNTISTARQELEEVISLPSYRTEEHQRIKKYFVTLNEEGKSLSLIPKKLRRFNAYLSTQDLGAFCGDIFLSQEKWNTLMSNCTKNRFFLCAEDVRSYEKTKEDFKKIFSNEVQEKFKETIECL